MTTNSPNEILLTFEWNEEKAAANEAKHRVGFEEGKSLFNDPKLLCFPDPAHSDFEPRSLGLGMSAKGRLLLLAFTERGDIIRLISCRKATARERRHYEKAT